MILLNMNVMNKVVLGVSKDPVRYYLNGIHVYDKDGFRYYEATDGHICFRAIDQIEGDALEGDYIIKMQSAVKSKPKYAKLVIADKDTAVIKADTKNAFDVIDGNYPDIDRIYPKNREFAKFYVAFQPEYMEKLKKVYGDIKILCKIPFMEDSRSSALWEWENDDTKYSAILMPLGLEA